MESYFDVAWNLFMYVVNWMQDTTILTVAGVNITFLGLLIALTVFCILLWVIYELLGLIIDLA